MPNPWEKYGSTGAAQGGIYTPPPNPQTVRQNERQDRNDARTAENEAARIDLARQDNARAAALLDAQKREAEAKALAAQLQAKQAQAEASAKDPFNPQALQGAAADAMAKLQTIDRIRKNINGAILPAVGMGADYFAGWGGTSARNVKADIGTLKAGGALSEVLKMTQATGKNPFTPMSNSDVELIASNSGNLDQGQTQDNFNSNLGNYATAYKRAYAGAIGMKRLNDEINKLLPGIPADKREAFKQDALRRYNEKMAAKNTPGAGAQQRSAPQSGVIDFNDWKH